MFAESKDEVALVLFGTDGTENALAGEDQYQSITVHRHLMLPDFDLLEDIESKIQPGSQQADCILFSAREDSEEISFNLGNCPLSSVRFFKSPCSEYMDIFGAEDIMDVMRIGLNVKLVTHYLVGCLDSKPSSLCPSDIERMGSTRRVCVC